MTDLDWNRVRAFLATAETGSLSAAARKLELTQPTLSRQVAALEAELGVTLFERIGKKLLLTEAGGSLLEHARGMGDAAVAMTFAATGRAQAIEGIVTISATDGYAAYILPEIVEQIREQAPQVTIVIVASNSLSDLQRREADIAIRHVRPEGDTLVGQLVREATAGIFASKEWVERNGLPRSPADIAPRDIIGFEATERFSEYLRGLGMRSTVDGFRLVSESSVVVCEMMRHGHGVCLMDKEIASRFRGVVELFPDLESPRFPVWLVTHRELRTSRRIRLVYDILRQALARARRSAGREGKRPS